MPLRLTAVLEPRGPAGAVADAKRPETRARRVAAVIDALT